MPIKISSDEFVKAMEKIMTKYEGDVTDVTRRLVKRAGQEGAEKLRRTSPKDTGRYARDWSGGRYVKTWSGAEITVYNEAPTYRLAHLLEHGHALRNGGRTKAIPHIKPVEEEVKQELEKNLRQAIEHGS